MTDKELLDWIEDEVRRCIGDGDWFRIMHELHADFDKNLTLHEAVERRIANHSNVDKQGSSLPH